MSTREESACPCIFGTRKSINWPKSWLPEISKTEAVRLALERELGRTDEEVPLLERIKIAQDRLAAYPKREGIVIDKAFFDELSGDY